MNKTYAIRRAAGLCWKCGKNATKDGKKCAVCKEIDSVRNKALWRDRRSKGLCGTCGKQLDDKRAQCQKCIDVVKRSRARDPEYAQKARVSNHAWHIKNGASWARRKNVAWRNQVFNHYGRQCACCGETIFEFLTKIGR